MILSLEKDDLTNYVTTQLNHFMPDKNKVGPEAIRPYVDRALERLDFCFSHVILNHYFDGKQTKFNHLFGDHYIMFVWFLANTIYKEEGRNNRSDKLYLLNKLLFSFDCMYDTKLPDIFLLFHSMGTMLGKGDYSDYFIALQGCTIGSQKGKYPVLGKGVSLTAHASVIGNCKIGNLVSISANTNVFEMDIEDNTTAFTTSSGELRLKKSKTPYALSFFRSIE